MGLNLSVFGRKNPVFWRLLTKSQTKSRIALGRSIERGYSTTLFLGSFPKKLVEEEL